MTTKSATLIGFTAIAMWSLLAALTVATGAIPAFQLAAMTFAVGALVGFLTWIGRPNAVKALRQPPVAWIVGVGGLFGYHALYFLALRFAPPAEAGLMSPGEGTRGATRTVSNRPSPIFTVAGTPGLPITGALAMSARMRASGQANAASQAYNCAVVTLIMPAVQPIMPGIPVNSSRI